MGLPSADTFCTSYFSSTDGGRLTLYAIRVTGRGDVGATTSANGAAGAADAVGAATRARVEVGPASSCRIVACSAGAGTTLRATARGAAVLEYDRRTTGTRLAGLASCNGAGAGG